MAAQTSTRLSAAGATPATTTRSGRALAEAGVAKPQHKQAAQQLDIPSGCIARIRLQHQQQRMEQQKEQQRRDMTWGETPAEALAHWLRAAMRNEHQQQQHMTFQRTPPMARRGAGWPQQPQQQLPQPQRAPAVLLTPRSKTRAELRRVIEALEALPKSHY